MPNCLEVRGRCRGGAIKGKVIGHYRKFCGGVQRKLSPRSMCAWCVDLKTLMLSPCLFYLHFVSLWMIVAGMRWNCMADSRFAPSQWETSLQSNAVSHWLGTNLESALLLWHISLFSDICIMNLSRILTSGLSLHQLLASPCISKKCWYTLIKEKLIISGQDCVYHYSCNPSNCWKFDFLSFSF